MCLCLCPCPCTCIEIVSFVYTCMCMPVHLCADSHAFVARVCTCYPVNACLCMHSHVHAFACQCMVVDACACLCTLAYSCICVWMHVHACTHKCSGVGMLTCVCAHVIQFYVCNLCVAMPTQPFRVMHVHTIMHVLRTRISIYSLSSSSSCGSGGTPRRRPLVKVEPRARVLQKSLR